MNKRSFYRSLGWMWMVCVITHTIHAQGPLVFVGETASVSFNDPKQQQSLICSIRVLTREGWLDQGSSTFTTNAQGQVQFTPDLPGLFVLTTQSGKPVEARLLAMDKPAPINRDALLRALPRQGKRLLTGEPITLLAIGDSVTATGDYPKLLAMMLQQATGNRNITVQVKAHPGKSVDATLRTYASDVLPLAPHIALLMYGLNDQGAGGSMDTYLKQSAWIAQRLASDANADVILLEPTPHIASTQDAFRTIGFAQAITQLGEQLHLPVACTFDAIWGKGGNSVDQCMTDMQPLFPPHYRRQWQSMLETEGKGDTIHPNVLGHLAMARAVFQTITGQNQTQKPLFFQAKNAWDANGLITHLTCTNKSATYRKGLLQVYAMDDLLTPILPDLTYELSAGQSQTFAIRWPQLRNPLDLLTLPASGYITHDRPLLAITDLADGHMNVQAVEPKSADDLHYPAQRIVTEQPEFNIQLVQGNNLITQTNTLQINSSVGTVPLITTHHGKTAVAQMSFTRFAQALTGTAIVDGKLDEWKDHTWSILGDPAQAHWTRGPSDKRATPDECMPRFTFKAAPTGLFMAISVMGDISQDRFTVFFDTRPPDQLGTPGGYVWLDGGFNKQGIFSAKRGETSPRDVKIQSAIQPTVHGSDIELFIPYSLMHQTHWPIEQQDIGLSVWWSHTGAAGKTQLLWSDRGHPWNTLHFGVLRHVDSPAATLPTLVHVWP